MSGVTTQVRNPKPKRQALTVWQLPKLLRPLHRYRATTSNACRERPHFRAILAFIHRNRFAVAAQIQRRFPKHLKSSRTARRHLAEMEALGLLKVVEINNTSPLWPKTYFVTRRGLARLKQALNEQGQNWSETLQDRRRAEGISSQHVVHELLITEFLLLAWEATQANGDLEILTTQRRSLAKHDAFKLVVGGRPTRLQPDGMFLYRDKGKGMMTCFVELDRDSMSIKQMVAKFRRYELWAESAAGCAFLKALYARHGAKAPTTVFRILVVISSRDHQAEKRRLAQLIKLAQACPTVIRNRLRFTTASKLNEGERQAIFSESSWYPWSRPEDRP